MPDHSDVPHRGEVLAAIESFIAGNFLLGLERNEIGGDDSLLKKGIVDSTGVQEIVMFIEKTYGIKVPDEDLLPENLDTVNRIAAFVVRKLEAGRRSS